MLYYCPECCADWSSEEIEDQICDACGYPDSDDDPMYDYEPGDDEMCPYCGNGLSENERIAGICEYCASLPSLPNMDQ